LEAGFHFVPEGRLNLDLGCYESGLCRIDSRCKFPPARAPNQASLRDASPMGPGPGDKSPGYCQVSLWDAFWPAPKATILTRLSRQVVRDRPNVL